jgi:hypothetical protein
VKYGAARKSCDVPAMSFSKGAITKVPGPLENILVMQMYSLSRAQGPARSLKRCSLAHFVD